MCGHAIRREREKVAPFMKYLIVIVISSADLKHNKKQYMKKKEKKASSTYGIILKVSLYPATD